MSPCKSDKTSFQLEGRFLSFVVKDGYKIKGLRLATSAGELYIKLSKEARASCRQVLTPGEWLQVTGYQQLDYEAGTVKFKAETIQVVAPSALQQQSVASELPVLPEQVESSALPNVLPNTLPKGAAPALPKACILVCQKSDCCKRGSRAVADAIQQTLGDRQLTPQVTIKATGCMKNCKAGANVVIQKTRYSHITPADVPSLIDRHFSTADTLPTGHTQPKRR